jgi:hypothetical protein
MFGGIGKLLGGGNLLGLGKIFNNPIFKMALGAATGNPMMLIGGLTDVVKSMSRQMTQSLRNGSSNASQNQPLGNFGRQVAQDPFGQADKLKGFGQNLAKYADGLKQLGDALGIKSFSKMGENLAKQAEKFQKIAAAFDTIKQAVTNLLQDTERISNGRANAPFSMELNFRTSSQL